MTDHIGDINEMVARKLGWTQHSDGQWNKSHELGGEVVMWKGFPAYATSIEAAWQIVEHFKKPKESQADNRFIISALNQIGWQASFNDSCVIADTAPKAICLAFLKLDAVSAS